MDRRFSRLWHLSGKHMAYFERLECPAHETTYSNLDIFLNRFSGLAPRNLAFVFRGHTYAALQLWSWGATCSTFCRVTHGCIHFRKK